MKNKNSRLSGLAQELDLPEDLGVNGYHLEIFPEMLVLDGCKTIAEYGDGVIRLQTGRNLISVFGSDLTIRSFTCGQVTVCGLLVTVEMG